MRIIIGFLKGGIVGGGLGFGFIYLGPLARAGWANYVLYALIGFLVGLIAGKPFWAKRADNESKLVPIIRAFLGAAVAVGFYALVVKALGDPTLTIAATWPQVGADAKASGVATTLGRLPYILGALIGIVYGVFVEIDDGGKGGNDGKSS
ncbi:MAG: hypothetical protein KAI47_18340 [Deltaproteobacteria bacterium]|nr:hypothetical protein [Deltaproteobacteria bacterium]